MYMYCTYMYMYCTYMYCTYIYMCVAIEVVDVINHVQVYIPWCPV